MNPGFICGPEDRILITGSNGFIGVKVVEMLLEYGFFNLRCFVRPSSKLESLKKVLEKYPACQLTEIVSGDLLSREDCRRAAQDVSVIVHLAAGFDKTFAGAFMNSALTTRNLTEAFLEIGRPKRFVNVSSFAVYSNLKMQRGALLDENSPLEDCPQERYQAYGFGKLKQEEIVMKYGQSHGLPYVILRPGAVFGPGKPELSGRIGIDTFGFFIHLGGSNELPLTYVDNCAEAIALAALKPGINGEAFNIVDDEKMTSREFLAACKSVKKFFTISVPYVFADLGCRLWESYSKRSQGQLPPIFNRRRCAAEWKGNRYSNEKLHVRLGWKPKVKMADAMKMFLAQYR
ncbi:MAG TPA: NAD(P)-dependent oxidoreductase [Verrucomicrobiae bacterium]|jgi:nucleoside-diphosphate-sugar epimerase|nr:NAD(P)-dependent oxidoreductase [Verrucomicrobiae bacterium]